jgi:hypothetical protein
MRDCDAAEQTDHVQADTDGNAWNARVARRRRWSRLVE